MPDRSNESMRRFVLGGLAGLASLLALQSLIWPRWPVAAPLDRQALAAALRARGFEANALAVLPARRSFEQATSEGLGFAIGEGQTLRLVRGIVRERFSIQAALFAASDPALTLRDRRLLSGPPPSALGRNGAAIARQTCLVSGPGGSGGFGVTGDQLLPLIDTLPSDRWQRLDVVLGSRLPRSYTCVLINVSGSPGRGAIAEHRWQALLAALRSALG